MGMAGINLDSKAWVKSIKNWQDFSIVCGRHLTFSKISASTEDVAFCVRLLKNEESHAEGAFSVKITAIYNFTRSLCWVKTLKGAGLRMVQRLAPGPHSPEWPHSQSFSTLSSVSRLFDNVWWDTSILWSDVKRHLLLFVLQLSTLLQTCLSEVQWFDILCCRLPIVNLFCKHLNKAHPFCILSLLSFDELWFDYCSVWVDILLP